MTRPKKNLKKVSVLPIEEHSTAAWANRKREKPDSKVPIPGEEDMELAREWVNHNQK